MFSEQVGLRYLYWNRTLNGSEPYLRLNSLEFTNCYRFLRCRYVCALLAIASNFTFFLTFQYIARHEVVSKISIEIANRITGRGDHNDSGHDNHPLISILCHNLWPDKSRKNQTHTKWKNKTNVNVNWISI